jgi:hypothetical protein
MKRVATPDCWEAWTRGYRTSAPAGALWRRPDY